MTALLLRFAGLVGIYLLVLTSISPGDVLVGALVAAAVLLLAGSQSATSRPARWDRWLVGMVRMVALTAWEMAVGTLRVVRFCLQSNGKPGFVEIPRGDRSRHAVALWGVLTGEAPDEYPVAVDDARHVLIVHLVDASDPAAVLERHAAATDGHLRDVVR